MHEIQKQLRRKATPAKAKASMWFFKTGPGEYGEGDLFLGVDTSDIHAVAKIHKDAPLAVIRLLLKSRYHEDRALGLKILVGQYQKEKDLKRKKKLVDFYLSIRSGINNWDLVDMSAYKIVGDYCLLTKNVQHLHRLSKSKRHWDRRMAIVGSFALIRSRKLDLTLRLSELFLHEEEDLMHKATGWMLRELGKRDQKKLLGFIRRHGKHMPRTMLRYSIEKFPASQRKKILLQTKPN